MPTHAHAHALQAMAQDSPTYICVSVHAHEREIMCTLEAATQDIAKKGNGHAACVGQVGRNAEISFENSEGKRLDVIAT